MAGACDFAAQNLGAGVADALKAVDCIAGSVSEQAFNRLFGSEGQLAFALSLLLVLYVGFFGFSLLLGRASLSVRALLPKMMTIGLVLTFATSFVAYQTFFYNIVVGGPNQIAGILTGTPGLATDTFAQKLDLVFLAVQQAGGDTTDVNAFSPRGMMWLGAMLLLLGTVGLLVTARIALALLLALGPVFVVLALFESTRGLFAGWLKGLVMMALTPLLAVLGGSIMLELAVPILAALTAVPGQINDQAAMAFLLVGAVHIALMFLALKVGATMVAGWQVFGLASAQGGAPAAAAGPGWLSPAASVAAAPGLRQGLAPAPPLPAARRRIELAAYGSGAAGASEPAAGSVSRRETRVYATSAASLPGGGAGSAASRTRGLGNRFRAPAGAAGARMADGAGAASALAAAQASS